MGEGVEWAVHCCLNLAWVGERPVPATRLAAYYDLPAAYLNKQLQALAKAGLLTSTAGRTGGFRLARAPERITLMDVVTAIEGPDPAFRCTEIRHRGTSGGQAGEPAHATNHTDADRCVIDQAMGAAEVAWRRELAARTVADLMATVERTKPDVPDRVRRGLTP